MRKIQVKYLDIILYVVVFLSLLDILSVSLNTSSIYYQMYFVIGCILFIYSTAVFAGKNTSPLIRLAYITCVVMALSILFNGDSPYAIMQIILWMLVMCSTYGVVVKSDSFQEPGGNIYFCFILISLCCTWNLFHPGLVSTYRQWTSILFQPYYLICLLPLILIRRDKLVVQSIYIRYAKMYMIVVVAILVLFSSKRGGFIALIFGLLIYYATIIFVAVEKKHRRTYIKNTIIILAIGIIALVVVSAVGDLSIFDRLAKIEWSSSGTSGRLDIWAEILNQYSKGTIIQKLFGWGYNATYNYTTINVAGHNDYINNLFDYGFVSIALQVILIIGLIVYYFKLAKQKSSMAPALGYSLAVFLVLSMVSGVLTVSTISMFLGYTWGLVLGNSRKEQEHIVEQKNILMV